ncbi:MAG: hypothetical protein PHE02_02725 [Lachnospiraceae bacterium]|nr:hypothetical protein [Lachnospiraceae bacterium]
MEKKTLKSYMLLIVYTIGLVLVVVHFTDILSGTCAKPENLFFPGGAISHQCPGIVKSDYGVGWTSTN